jgi:hypothetical protein
MFEALHGCTGNRKEDRSTGHDLPVVSLVKSVSERVDRPRHASRLGKALTGRQRSRISEATSISNGVPQLGSDDVRTGHTGMMSTMLNQDDGARRPEWGWWHSPLAVLETGYFPRFRLFIFARETMPNTISDVFSGLIHDIIRRLLLSCSKLANPADPKDSILQFSQSRPSTQVPHQGATISPISVSLGQNRKVSK